MTRGAMTMRATLSRPDVTTDAWNRPSESGSTTSLGTVACYVWLDNASLVIDEGKEARVDQMRGLFPKSLDIQADDILGDVTDRQGTVLFKGPFRVRNPYRRTRHQEADLQGHSVGA